MKKYCMLDFIKIGQINQSLREKKNIHRGILGREVQKEEKREGLADFYIYFIIILIKKYIHILLTMKSNVYNKNCT